MVRYLVRRTHPLSLLLVIVILCEILRVICTPENSRSSTMTEIYYRSSSSNTLPHPMTAAAQRIATVWNDLYDAIFKFVHEYQSRYQLIVTPTYELEQTQPYEMGIGKLAGILRMRFSLDQNGTTYQSAVILKVPRLGELFDYGQSLRFHTIERFMYEHILPLIQSLEQPQIDCSPIFYGSTANQTLVLEDLQETGFRPVLDLHNQTLCEVVLRTLAKFHAFSITRVSQFSADKLDALTVQEKQFLVDDRISVEASDKFAKYVLPRLTGRILEDMANMRKKFRTANNSAYVPDKDGFNVIVHGHPEPEVVFFSSEVPSRTCKFVDFQNSRSGSPVIDLVIYLMSSVEFEVFEASCEKLVAFYLQELEATFRERSPDADARQNLYSMDALCGDLRKHKWFFIFRLVVIVPLHWGRSSAFAPDSNSEDYYDFLFRTPTYLSIFKGWWKFLTDCRITPD